MAYMCVSELVPVVRAEESRDHLQLCNRVIRIFHYATRRTAIIHGLASSRSIYQVRNEKRLISQVGLQHLRLYVQMQYFAHIRANIALRA